VSNSMEVRLASLNMTPGFWTGICFDHKNPVPEEVHPLAVRAAGDKWEAKPCLAAKLRVATDKIWGGAQLVLLDRHDGYITEIAVVGVGCDEAAPRGHIGRSQVDGFLRRCPPGALPRGP
jgi:hypothetical protein